MRSYYTESENPTVWARELISRHLGPVVGVIEAMDPDKEVGFPEAAAIATLAMKAKDSIEEARRSEEACVQDMECYEAEAVCSAIALLAFTNSSEGLDATREIEGPDDRESFEALQSLTGLIKTRWMRKEGAGA